jgi:hypothetical protein
MLSHDLPVRLDGYAKTVRVRSSQIRRNCPNERLVEIGLMT